ncbi:MAG: 4Fe-4S dicluster domain-containing protein, partial [Candidatus Thiodiazotropha endolucinida]
NPSKLARLARARQFDQIKQANVTECVECGSCTYSCPSGIPIVQLIRSAKSELRGKRGRH